MSIDGLLIVLDHLAEHPLLLTTDSTCVAYHRGE